MIMANKIISGKNKILEWETMGHMLAVGLAFFLPISTAMTSVLITLLLLVWILGPNLKKKKQILFHHPLSGWIFPIVILTLVGVIYSIGDNESIRHSLRDGLRLGLIPILIYFYQSKKISKIALWAFSAAMVLTLFLAFLKIYANFPIGLKYTTGGVFKSHIKTSYFMAMAAFFLATQLKTLSLRHRLVTVFVIVLMIYYLFFMNEGRIGYITFVLCSLLLAWQWYRLKGILLMSFLAVVMLMGAYFTSSVFSARMNLLVQDMDFYHQGGRLLESSLGSRIQFAHASGELVAQKPIIGWGTGSFGPAYAKLFEDQNTLLTDNPHNEYLRMSVELGLLGLIFLLGLFYQQWRLSMQLPKDIRGFCQGMLLTFMLGCLLNSWLKDFTEGYFYCLMTAICFASMPIQTQKVLVKATLH
ncbi:MAG: O-antigen ligase family protein [Proteobacteria bacterium]|nr:O-antigen ligase family protein [Pseudomonadota bacterium]